MLGALVNSIAIIVCTILGLLLRKILTEKLIEHIGIGLGICILLVGLYGVVKSDLNNEVTIVVLVSFVIGTIIGYYLKIDRGFEKLGDGLSKIFASKVDSTNNIPFSEGFIQATMTFCVGAMVIYGSIQAGLGDNGTLYVKSVMDGITSMILTIKYGPSVFLSAIPVFLIQGGIALASSYISDYLNSCINFKNCLSIIGGIFVFMIGFNMIGVKKINIPIMLPALLGTIYYLICK